VRSSEKTKSKEPSTATTKTNDSKPLFDLPSAEEATKHMQDLNERLIESSKIAGNVTLDGYDNALYSLVDFEEKVASASRLEWISALATTHARFVADLSSSYTQAARQLLT
jgi:hypothetical protein